jgi:hypothetical protein
MGIKVEFNPDLALRNILEYKNGLRGLEECIPENLQAGNIYNFLKLGQRLYWLEGELPLLETSGGENLSRPIASIIILEATHFKNNDLSYTKGKYKVVDVFTDEKVHFESYKKVV